jgi:hypothetical protein
MVDPAVGQFVAHGWFGISVPSTCSHRERERGEKIKLYIYIYIYIYIFRGNNLFGAGANE